MLDPTLMIRKQFSRNNRRGAIAPLFAVLCPVMLIFAGFAINLAYMQLVSTELKIATDATCHAGGRAMSLRQAKDPSLSQQQNIQNAIDQIIAQAEITAQANKVGGKVLSVGADESSPSQIQLTFGRSVRGNNGYGMYQFSPIPMSEIEQGNKRPSSLAVTGSMPISTVFRMFAFKKRISGQDDSTGNASNGGSEKKSHGTWQGGSEKGFLQSGLNDFTPIRRSIATQVDRDIALVLDRSGSMLFYQDEDALEDRIWDLYNSKETFETPGYWKYHYWKWSNRRRRYYSQGYYKPNEQPWGSRILDDDDKRWQEPTTYEERYISSSERSNALDSLYQRSYSDNVIYQLERWTNLDNHTLGSSYSNSERNELTDQMAAYCADWRYSDDAPEFSRWDFLHRGVTAFLNVLDDTDQDELVSLVTFSSSASLDLNLQSTYETVREEVADIKPYGGTAIGDGMTTGLPPIVSGAAARPFAAKTIIVLTDGENNAGEDPEDAVEDIIGSHNVTIHTVTFSKGADKDAMEAVATAGRGRHYHTDDGEQLVPIFEEIANNLPTILTE